MTRSLLVPIFALILAAAAAPAALAEGGAATPADPAAPPAAPPAAIPDAGATGEPEAATSPESAPELVIVDAAGRRLDEFLWVSRPLVVFADTPADPRFQRQMELLSQRPEELTNRDVVVIVDTDPRALSDIRRQLRPRGFSFVLLDKDGTITLRKPEPWHVREITRAIDKTPLRQQEIKEERRKAAEAAAAGE